MKRLLALSLIVSAVALAQCGSCPQARTPSCHCTSAVSVLAGLTLCTAYGDTVRLADYIGRKPTVVVFLRPGDASTVAMDTLRVVAQHYPAATVLGIMAADRKTTKGADVRIGPGFPLLVDPGRTAQALLDVDSVPVALFFDSTGAPAWQTARFTTAQVTRGLSAIVAPAEYTDPVCGMKVTAASAAGTINYEGRPYYFCSAACRTAFAREPQKYLNRQ